MHRSKIEWTDYSGGYANFVRRGREKGDCEYGPGCAHCYVTRIWVRNPDEWPLRTKMYPLKLAQLARCKPHPRDKPYRRGEGSKPMVFVCDTGDMCHDRVIIPFIFQALDVMYKRPDIDFQILTKRIARFYGISEIWLDARGLDRFPSWMWIMTSASNQPSLEKRVHWLLKVRATIRGLSLEPLIGPIDLQHVGGSDQPNVLRNVLLGEPKIHWVVGGGESGPDARVCHSRWVRNLHWQCEAFDSEFFFKQWGEWSPYYQQDVSLAHRQMTYEHDHTFYRYGRKLSGDLLDGHRYHAWPDTVTPAIREAVRAVQSAQHISRVQALEL